MRTSNDVFMENPHVRNVTSMARAVAIKQLFKRNGMVQLRSGNPTFAPILFRDGQTMTICGVVTASIKLFR